MAKIDSLREACTSLIRRAAHPDLLWHYTSADALVGIAKSGALHLSCHSFMNDPAEGLRSPALVTSCWHAAIDRVASHPKLDLKYLRDTSRALSAFGEYKQRVPPTFLASFTVLRDSLSQWARYGADGAGVALGFRVDPAAFERFQPAEQWSYGPFLYGIFYEQHADGGVPSPSSPDIAQLRRQLEDLFSEFISQVDNPTDVENALHLIAHDLRPIIKQAAYHEEKEWRIAAYAVEDSTGLYDIRPGRFGLSPYLTLPLGNGIELKEIVLGPKLPIDNEWSANWLCQKYGINAGVTRSGFTYR